MSRALSVLMIGFVAACARETPAPTEFTLPVFSHASPMSSAANGGNFGTPLSGAEEVPPRETQARGNAIFRLNAAGDALTYKLIVANIENAFMAHIHSGAAGANGPIVVWLYPSTEPVPGPPGQGRIDGVIAVGVITPDDIQVPSTLPSYTFAALLADLRSANAYVNVHTNDAVAPVNTGPGDFPGGEIRGQIETRGH